jgi:hypothetical protein
MESYEGRGLRQINTCCKVPLRENFLMTAFCFGVYIVTSSMVRTLTTASVSAQTREYVDWRSPISRVRLVVMVFSAHLAEVGMPVHPFRSL